MLRIEVESVNVPVDALIYLNTQRYFTRHLTPPPLNRNYGSVWHRRRAGNVTMSNDASVINRASDMPSSKLLGRDSLTDSSRCR